MQFDRDISFIFYYLGYEIKYKYNIKINLVFLPPLIIIEST